jgi:carbohydrate-selective porin OprB
MDTPQQTGGGGNRQALAPWLTLQPDMQYIIKPSGMSHIANALVGSMQITINF